MPVIIPSLPYTGHGKQLRTVVMSVFFLVILIVEAVLLSVFGYLAARGFTEPAETYWVGTFLATLAAAGLAWVIPKQPRIMLLALADHYVVVIDTDTITVTAPAMRLAKQEKLTQTPDAFVTLNTILPGMKVLTIFAEGISSGRRTGFGLSLPRSEQLRLAQAIHHALAETATSIQS